MDFCCALCGDSFPSELDRATHFAHVHPISDPEELSELLAQRSSVSSCSESTVCNDGSLRSVSAQRRARWI